ncbi:unnamed protein product [Citrullus colocynthis]|uniref:RING-type domain-containing protein n=1 Tax=Citrullus colocynthis TaxID=252529 RepID=A0ABP0Z5F9_9ROSI
MASPIFSSLTIFPPSILPPPSRPSSFVLSPFVEYIAVVSMFLLFLLCFYIATLCSERATKSNRKNLVETLQIEAPDFSYSKHDGGEKECVICLCEIEEGEKCRKMSTCDHVFHRDCIDQWFTVDCHCPLCRTAVCVVVVEK